MTRTMTLSLRALLLCAAASLFSLAACWVLWNWGLKVLIVSGAMFAGFALVWVCWWLNDTGRLDTSKIMVFALIYIGSLMAGATYYLAYLDKAEIAEALSKVVVTELIAPPALLLLKALFENFSKNNTWPDKPADKTKKTGSQPEI